MAAPDPTHLLDDPAVPAAERAFYVDEFRGATIVVSLAAPTAETVASVGRAAAALATGDGRLLAVVSGEAGPLAAALPTPPMVLDAPGDELDASWLAALWLAITDEHEVIITAEPGREAPVAAELAVAVGALKLVTTDAGGGWGRPARSFADIATHAEALHAQLAERQGGALVAAIDRALAGGVSNVNLCRPEDLDRELFTFDGAGTLFTSGGYVALGRLRVDDLPAVERLVSQGVAEGLLRPRGRLEVARLAVSGLGARVVGSGRLAGIVGLETEAYLADGVGEIACLYTVSSLSGKGAGAQLVDGVVDQAAELGLRAVFAVTVSAVAADFFVRRGFREVGLEEVPAAKWAGYDARRRTGARAFWCDVGDGHEQRTLGF